MHARWLYSRDPNTEPFSIMSHPPRRRPAGTAIGSNTSMTTSPWCVMAVRSGWPGSSRPGWWWTRPSPRSSSAAAGPDGCGARASRNWATCPAWWRTPAIGARLPWSCWRNCRCLSCSARTASAWWHCWSRSRRCRARRPNAWRRTWIRTPATPTAGPGCAGPRRKGSSGPRRRTTGKARWPPGARGRTNRPFIPVSCWFMTSCAVARWRSTAIRPS